MGNLQQRVNAAQERVAAAVDETAARELRLFIDNDGQLYRQQTTSIIKNILRKMIGGKYNHKMAPKLWLYLVDNGAKKYCKEFCSPGDKWSNMFPKKLREFVAQEMADDFLDDVNSGSYDPKDFGVKGTLPKKIKK